MNEIKAGKTTLFPSLNALLEDENFSLTKVQGIEEHISKHIVEFNNYIPENARKYSWIRNPFNIETEDLLYKMINSSKLQEQLIRRMMKYCHDFKKQNKLLSSFWIKIYKEKPILGGEALKALLPFATTFLCEAGFSAFTVIKTKYRGHLQP